MKLSIHVFCLSGFAALSSCTNVNIPIGLSAVGNPQETLPARYPLSSWQCGRKPYVTFHPGQTLVSSDTINAPTFDPKSQLFTGPSSPSSTGKYVFLMVDPNTNTTDPTYPALHTLYANVTASNGDLSWTVLAPYINPEPTAGAPHNYTMLLFEQPSAQFMVPSKFSSFLPLNLSNLYAREGFPVLDFIHDTGLGEPVAANWFQESATGTSTSSSAVPSVSICSVIPTSSPSGTGVVRNPTATATGIFSSGAITSTATSISPPVAGDAVVSSANTGNVLIGLGAVFGAFGLL
ncbi:hypothetical protein UA08_06845 [Talaromyces atroroseus]|uniref:PEBP-like protein n=1 Tax=Talaromyces atroroseus TaxID=1441469 RepID=A0A225AAV3_TALAT|nr:hypothetical protein UA08_06845 [Talaromyces atroroseus]OKL58022.1 hypothetical protein UA08_06845 [Talaromyces atroroseus]